MFSLHFRDELVFGGSHISQLDNLIADNYAFLQTSNLTSTKPKTIKLGIQKSNTKKSDEYGITRSNHRDNERQRRSHMAKLHASLRSLLPLQYIKGKRSVSDHMQKAVNYIKILENNIQELKIRRDKLKKISQLSDSKNIGRSNDISRNFVMVNLEKDGVEILISSKSSEFGLSRALVELQGREMNVISFVSTKLNDGFLHKIQAEASDLTNLDLSLLKERLTRAIN